MSVTYPLDLSGVNPSNLVANELHSVNEAHFRDYFFIVPQLAPFYVDNFSISITNGGVDTPLTEDVDYSFALPYVTGTRHTGKAMYGAITMHNLESTGILKVAYQTVGGEQVCDRLQVLGMLADKAYNPRTTIWDIVANQPSAFPPVPHYQDYDTISGQAAVVTALNEIKDAILSNSSVTADVIETFLFNFNQGNSTAYIKKTGDAMSGPLEIQGTPLAGNHAVNKDYVDSSSITPLQLSTLLNDFATLQDLVLGLNTKVDKAGGILTGQLLLVGDPVSASDAARKAYVDGLITAQAATITALQTALNNYVAAGTTKQYVDDQVATINARINSL